MTNNFLPHLSSIHLFQHVPAAAALLGSGNTAKLLSLETFTLDEILSQTCWDTTGCVQLESDMDHFVGLCVSNNLHLTINDRCFALDKPAGCHRACFLVVDEAKNLAIDGGKFFFPLGWLLFCKNSSLSAVLCSVMCFSTCSATMLGSSATSSPIFTAQYHLRNSEGQKLMPSKAYKAYKSFAQYTHKELVRWDLVARPCTLTNAF